MGALRMIAQCENANLPIGFFPGFPRHSEGGSPDASDDIDRSVHVSDATPAMFSRTFFFRRRRHQARTSTQDRDGPGSLQGLVLSSKDPVCDSVRNAPVRATE